MDGGGRVGTPFQKALEKGFSERCGSWGVALRRRKLLKPQCGPVRNCGAIALGFLASCIMGRVHPPTPMGCGLWDPILQGQPPMRSAHRRSCWVVVGWGWLGVSRAQLGVGWGLEFDPNQVHRFFALELGPRPSSEVGKPRLETAGHRVVIRRPSVGSVGCRLGSFGRRLAISCAV